MVNGSTLIAGGSIKGVTSQLRFEGAQPRSDKLISLFSTKPSGLATTTADNDKRIASSDSASDSGVKPPKMVIAHHGGADIGLGIYESQYWGGYQYGNYGGVPYSTYFPSRSRPTHVSHHKYYHPRPQFNYAPKKYLWG